MRFGVQTPQSNVSATDVIGFWQFLDRETRFESVWLMDHLLPPADEIPPDVACFESWMLLAAGAQATERLRLGTLVSANTFRHPALLAKMAATVDHVSGGRLEIGLGAGWHEGEHRAFGIPLPAMQERQDRLEEAAALLRAIFEAEKRVTFHGAYYELVDAPFQPPFVQEPHPPLLIGGTGERRTLRTVARFADVANLMGPLSVVEAKLAVLRRHCDAIGRDYDAIVKTIHVPLVAQEDPAVVEIATGLIAAHFGLTEQTVRDELPVGSPARVLDQLARFEALGVSAIYFPTLPPWDREAFGRLSEQVVAPMQQGSA